MNSVATVQRFYIGWDVGGWNCARNNKSRDAIVILNEARSIVGRPWRGNLRRQINEAEATEAWILALFDRCEAEVDLTISRVYLAIDTPLGFSDAFCDLVTDMRGVATLGNSRANPYLFRKTERLLFKQGFNPLSAVKDMIGSQATKGIHVLARFARDTETCGVWKGGSLLTALEAYPSICRNSATISSLRTKYDSLGHKDEEDALTCALIAYLYATQQHLLVSPDKNISASEGWIWFPKDALGQTGSPSKTDGLLRGLKLP